MKPFPIKEEQGEVSRLTEGDQETPIHNICKYLSEVMQGGQRARVDGLCGYKNALCESFFATLECDLSSASGW